MTPSFKKRFWKDARVVDLNDGYVVALLMFIGPDIKEHRIQESMSQCLKGKRVAMRTNKNNNDKKNNDINNNNKN